MADREPSARAAHCAPTDAARRRCPSLAAEASCSPGCTASRRDAARSGERISIPGCERAEGPLLGLGISGSDHSSSSRSRGDTQLPRGARGVARWRGGTPRRRVAPWLLLAVLAAAACLARPAAGAGAWWPPPQASRRGISATAAAAADAARPGGPGALGLLRAGARALQEAAWAALPGVFGKHWSEVFPQQWAAYRADLERLRFAPGGAGGGGGGGGEPRGLPPHVARLFNGSELLNPASMARGLAFVGGAHRLRRVMRDLAAASQAASGGGGQQRQQQQQPPPRPVKIAVLGGSISWGSAVTGGVDDWFTLVEARLREAFPGAEVVARNGAVPATPSSFMNTCLQNYLDDDADLVFLEYATNDGWDIADEARRRALGGGATRGRRRAMQGEGGGGGGGSGGSGGGRRENRRARAGVGRAGKRSRTPVCMETLMY
jgi:hypothetical protein